MSISPTANNVFLFQNDPLWSPDSPAPIESAPNTPYQHPSVPPGFEDEIQQLPFSLYIQPLNLIIK